MSVLTDGTPSVSVVLFDTTEQALVNPNSFLAFLDQAVSRLKTLTGHLPGTSPRRVSNPSKLRIVEVSSTDPDVINEQFAVWSPAQGYIKLNTFYKDQFISAANTSPAVFELAEALGTASMAFQVENPESSISSSKQIIGTGPFAQGFSRAIGLYAFYGLQNISSIWSVGKKSTFDELLTQDLVRAYRKVRLNYSGDHVLGITTSTEPADSDISYGMFAELFTAFSNWQTIQKFIKEWVNPYQILAARTKAFSRTTLKSYDELILNISKICNINIESLLNTWLFNRTDILSSLPEHMQLADSTKSMVVSNRFARNVDSEVLDKSINGANKFGISLGGSDAFGLSQSSHPVLVLLGEEPVDGVSFKGLSAEFLDGYESNQLPKSYILPVNLGESSPAPVTLIIPDSSITPWDLESYVKLNVSPGQVLVHGKVVTLGEPTRKYKLSVSRWSGDDINSLTESKQDIEIPISVFAVFALDQFGYRYSTVNGKKSLQLISEETVPIDRYTDPNTGTDTYIPNGSIKIIRSCLSSTESTGLMTRAFTETSIIKNSAGTVLCTYKNEISPTTDPMSYLLRERPLSGNRTRLDVLSGIGHPVLTERVGFGTRLIGSGLASDTGLTLPVSGIKTYDQAQQETLKTTTDKSIQVISLPTNFIAKLSDILNSSGNGTTLDEKLTSKLEQTIIEFDALDTSVKNSLNTVDINKTISIPDLYQYSLLLPLGTGKNPNYRESIDLGMFLVGISKTKPSNTARERYTEALQAVYSLEKANIDALYTYVPIQDSSARETEKVITTTSFIRGFLSDGLSGAFQATNDPQNPINALDGTFISNVYGLFLPGQLVTNNAPVPLFNPAGNPRAVSKVIGGLVQAASVAVKVPPGIAGTVNQSIQDAINLMAQEDKPPLGSVVLQAAHTVAGGIVQNFFSGDEARVYQPILGFVTNQLINWTNGSKGLSQTITEAGKPAATALSNAIADLQNNSEYLPISIGLKSDNPSQPLKALLITEGGDYVPVLDSDNTPIYKLDDTSSNYIDLFSDGLKNVVTKISTNSTPSQQRNSEQISVQNMFGQLSKADISNTASLAKFKAALLEQHYYDEARSVLADLNLESEDSDINTTTEKALKILSGISYFTVSQLESLKATNTTTSTLNSVFTVKNLKSAIEDYKNNKAPLGESYKNYPIGVFNVYNEIEQRVALIKKLKALYPSNLTLATVSYSTNTTVNSNLKTNTKMFSIAQIKQVGGGRSYTFEVMPAIKSVAQTPGMQAPGVGHGISWRSSLNIAKLNVPGSVPIYQVMGVSEEVIEFSGAFLGFREKVELNSDSSQAEYYDTSDKQYFRAQQESEAVKSLQMSGSLLELTIKSYAGSQDNNGSDNGIYINVKGYIHQFQRHIKSDDRVWYQIVFRIHDTKVISTAQEVSVATQSFAVSGGGGGIRPPATTNGQHTPVIRPGTDIGTGLGAARAAQAAQLPVNNATNSVNPTNNATSSLIATGSVNPDTGLIAKGDPLLNHPTGSLRRNSPVVAAASRDLSPLNDPKEPPANAPVASASIPDHMLSAPRQAFNSPSAATAALKTLLRNALANENIDEVYDKFIEPDIKAVKLTWRGFEPVHMENLFGSGETAKDLQKKFPGLKTIADNKDKYRDLIKNMDGLRDVIKNNRSSTVTELTSGTTSKKDSTLKLPVTPDVTTKDQAKIALGKARREVADSLVLYRSVNPKIAAEFANLVLVQYKNTPVVHIFYIPAIKEKYLRLNAFPDGDVIRVLQQFQDKYNGIN